MQQVSGRYRAEKASPSPTIAGEGLFLRQRLCECQRQRREGVTLPLWVLPMWCKISMQSFTSSRA